MIAIVHQMTADQLHALKDTYARRAGLDTSHAGCALSQVCSTAFAVSDPLLFIMGMFTPQLLINTVLEHR